MNEKSTYTFDAALVNYLVKTIDESIDAIEQVSLAKREGGQETLDGRSLIHRSLWTIGLHFATIDGDLTDDEADFIASAYWVRNRRYQLRNHIGERIKQYRRPLDVPLAILYLNDYGKAHGGDYADKAKAMFFRFANAVEGRR